MPCENPRGAPRPSGLTIARLSPVVLRDGPEALLRFVVAHSRSVVLHVLDDRRFDDRAEFSDDLLALFGRRIGRPAKVGVRPARGVEGAVAARDRLDERLRVGRQRAHPRDVHEVAGRRQHNRAFVSAGVTRAAPKLVGEARRPAPAGQVGKDHRRTLRRRERHGRTNRRDVRRIVMGVGDDGDGHAVARRRSRRADNAGRCGGRRACRSSRQSQRRTAPAKTITLEAARRHSLAATTVRRRPAPSRSQSRRPCRAAGAVRALR